MKDGGRRRFERIGAIEGRKIRMKCWRMEGREGEDEDRWKMEWDGWKGGG